MENVFRELLDLNRCRQLIAAAEAAGELAILCPHYSINIASKYDNGELLQAHYDELEEELGVMLSVSESDDLVVDFTQVN